MKKKLQPPAMINARHHWGASFPDLEQAQTRELVFIYLKVMNVSYVYMTNNAYIFNSSYKNTYGYLYNDLNQIGPIYIESGGLG